MEISVIASIKSDSDRYQVLGARKSPKTPMFSRVVAIVACSLFVFPGLALAHAKLVSSQPPQGFSGASPNEITLNFNEASKVIFVKLRNEKKEELSALSSPEESGKAIKLKVVQPLPAAIYSLEYRVITDDGHPVSGSVSFRVN